MLSRIFSSRNNNQTKDIVNSSVHSDQSADITPASINSQGRGTSNQVDWNVDDTSDSISPESHFDPNHQKNKPVMKRLDSRENKGSIAMPQSGMYNRQTLNEVHSLESHNPPDRGYNIPQMTANQSNHGNRKDSPSIISDSPIPRPPTRSVSRSLDISNASNHMTGVSSSMTAIPHLKPSNSIDLSRQSSINNSIRPNYESNSPILSGPFANQSKSQDSAVIPSRNIDASSARSITTNKGNTGRTVSPLRGDVDRSIGPIDNMRASVRSGDMSAEASIHTNAKEMKSMNDSSHANTMLGTVDPSELLSKATSLAISLRKSANESKLLQSIKGADELVRKLDEFLLEIEQQKEDISNAILRTQGNVLITMNLANIIKTLSEGRVAIDELSKMTPKLFFMYRKKWKKKISDLAQTFRTKCNQLMSSVTLDKLAIKDQIIIVEGYTLPSAYAAYYGIGRPKNYKEAVTKLGYLAEKESNVEAMILLAEIYLSEDKGIAMNIVGYGVVDSIVIAKQWLQRAAEMDSVIAKARLGQVLVDEARNPVDVNDSSDITYQRGRDLLLEAALGGSMEAETTLGVLAYEQGDFILANEWFERAAQHGHPRAINHLGLLYFHGDGVIKQPELAYQYFITAVASGDDDACTNAAICLERGVGTEKNVLDAMSMYHLGAKRGNVQAMYSFGFLLVKRGMSMYDLVASCDQNQIFLTRPNPRTRQRFNLNRKQPTSESLSYISYAKEKNEANLQSLRNMRIIRDNDATTNVGPDRDMYEEVSIVMTEGIHWMRKAVEGGITEASFQLGQIYEQGLGGTAIDQVSAYHQYFHAANTHPPHPRAALYVGHMLYAGQGVDQSFPLACYYYEIAAEAGLVDGMNAAAILLEDGRGTSDQSPCVADACMWYLEAAKQGSEQAAINLSILIKQHVREISFVNTRLGGSLTTNEVYSFLMKQYPSCKYIFEQQQEYLRELVGITRKAQDADNSIGKDADGIKLSRLSHKAKNHRYRVDSSINANDGNENVFGTASTAANEDLNDPSLIYHEYDVIDDRVTDRGTAGYPIRSRNIVSKFSGTMKPPNSLRGDLRQMNSTEM